MARSMLSNRKAEVELFTEAIKLSTEERISFLDRACAGDQDLRRRIEKLLRNHDRAGEFMEAPLTGSINELRPKISVGEKPGDRIGRYKLLQQIGEGGCGIVFLAEQEEPVRRRVALKLVKPGMDTKSVIARFEAERQALALMDHPCIARVFDAGATENGRPYFVMELVDGVKITDYCDQHALPTSQRLELFVQVCIAIQHAHQKGIIHRDIKPSNILVTTDPEGKPVPKVIDFGIAKAIGGQRLTEKTIITAAELVIGTPAYMSPEQAALQSADVDTRTDIYSLGVLLYELLTGTTPFDTRELLKAGFDEVRRVIREVQPVRPSTRMSEMVAVELISVSKHRATEAPKLIREMRGELDWIVTKALEKVRTRRYATANGLAMDVGRYLSGEAILARPPSAWYQLQKLARRNRLLFGALSSVATMLVIGLAAVSIAFTREKAARREAQADKTNSEEVTHLLEDMLGGVGPSMALGRDTVMLREISDKTAGRVAVELTNQPAVQAKLQIRLGTVYEDLGEYTKAEEILRKALATRLTLFGPKSEAASDVFFELGHVLLNQLRRDEAESYLRRALAIRQKIFGEKDFTVAKCYEELGAVFLARHQLPQAEEMLQKSLMLQRQLLGDDSPESGDSRRGLGSVFFEQGRYHEAEQMIRQAITNSRALAENHPMRIQDEHNLATVLYVEGKKSEAEDLLKRTVTAWRKIYPQGHQRVADSLLGLTRVLIGQRRFKEAEATARDALAEARKIEGDMHPQVIQILHDLINILLQQHSFEEVEPLFADILPPSRESKREYASLLLERCEAFARRGRWREAAGDARVLVKEAPDTHEYYHTLGPLLVQLGDIAEYQKLCSTILDKFSGSTNVLVGDRMAKDCLILPSSGVDPGAVTALADVAVNHGSNTNASPYFQFCKGLAEFRLGHLEEAVKWSRLAANGPFPCPKAGASAIIAMAEYESNQPDKARSALNDCEKVIEGKLPKLEQGELGADWRDWIIVHALHSEAKQMIKDDSHP